MDDVLVVGGGPTGMMMAACLVAAGVRCRIIDKQPVRSDKSRALVVHAKTLELFQRLGLADELIARGRTSVNVEWYVGERPPLSIDLGHIGIPDSPYPFLLFVSQVETERALEGYLRAHGIEIERPVELVSFTQDEDGVTAQLAHGDANETVRVRYLVGGDGAHSVVRKGAGLKFEGAPYTQNFLLADTEVDWDAPEGVLRLFLSEHGMLVAFPMPGKSRYRILAAEGADAPGEAAADPSLAEVQALATKLSSVPIRLRDPHWLARFHLHHRGVDHYRAGRAFVAGDAAHIHSPAGGQGMNTGLQDAANLAWKMALVLRGVGSEKLLASYEMERQPVGRQLLKFTDRLFSFAASRNRWLVQVRDFVLPHLVPLVSSSDAGRARVFRYISQLGIHYRKSAIVEEHDSLFGRGFASGPRAGERAPDGLLAGGGTLFSQWRDARHQLLVFGEATAELRALENDWLGVLQISATNELKERYGVTQPSVYLIRPDGYVAYRAANLDAGGISRFIAKY